MKLQNGLDVQDLAYDVRTHQIVRIVAIDGCKSGNVLVQPTIGKAYRTFGIVLYNKQELRPIIQNTNNILKNMVDFAT